MEKQLKMLKPDLFSEIENDGLVHVKNLKKGDIIYECESNTNYELYVRQDAQHLKSGWTCLVENTEGEIFELYVSKGISNMGPRIYKCPQYLEDIEDRGLFYVIK